jgi:hypothetical protein
VSNRQDELLKNEDGRYFAIGKVGTGLGSVATGERLGKTVVSFGLPSGPALFLHLARRAFDELQRVDPRSLFNDHAAQGIWPDSHGPLFDFFETSIAHVVFSFTALEAFANEALPADFTYSRTMNGETELFLRAEIERRISLTDKLALVLPTALSVTSPKGLKVWQHYVSLKRIRDRLIHLKSIDRKPSGPDEETIWGFLLNTPDRPWCDQAHELIGHFGPAVNNRRWYGLYPYVSES